MILNFEESCCQQYARNSAGTTLTKDSPAATFTTVVSELNAMEAGGGRQPGREGRRRRQGRDKG